jgi:hypothetical protein
MADFLYREKINLTVKFLFSLYQYFAMQSTLKCSKRQTLYFLNFKIENENFQIYTHQRMIRRSPAILQNCQNIILFQETIP